jgi:IS30 family transposase
MGREAYDEGRIVERVGLTICDRTLIELRLRDGLGIRAIARELGRSGGTISGEIKRHGGRVGYRAEAAIAEAVSARRRCGRKRCLAPGSALWSEVERLIFCGWSPEQIAGRRERVEEGVKLSSGLSVSHETIYAAIYALPRGELKRELIDCLRQGKPRRGRPRKDAERRGKLCDIINIRERPEEVEGRLVPGHWEGDLIVGARGASAIGTLVERTTRFVVLVQMASRKAEVASSAFAGALNAIPEPLRQTLTYDQGKEMADHKRLAEATGMRIFFADPHSPWQRGSNENTNGLLRQYFPKGTSLAGYDQADLDRVANSLNSRPRKTLDFATPQEEFTKLIARAINNQTTPNKQGVRSGT